MSCFRTDIQKGSDIRSGTPDGILLKCFANRIKKHYGNPLRVFADVKGTYCCDSHQKKLGENITFSQMDKRLMQDRESDRQIGDAVPEQLYGIGKPWTRNKIINGKAREQ